jgi:protein-disulfide isomerase
MISMRKFLKYSALLLLSFSLFAQTAGKKPAAAPAAKGADAAPPQPPAGAPPKELAEAYFKRMYGYDSNIQVNVASISLSPIPDIYDVTGVLVTPEGQQAGHWFVSADFKYAILGDLEPFGADPFATARAELAKSAFGPTKGPADAKLLIVEFADLECPACKEAAPVMEKLRNDFPEARFVFQSFPLTMLHPWALRASEYLDCIARAQPDLAFTFIDAVFSHQKDIEAMVRKTDANGKTTVDDADVTERLRHYTETAGADAAATQKCAESPATLDRIARSEQVGQALGITGTPTIFINGRRIGNPSGARYDALKGVVTYEAAQAAQGK